MSLADLKEILRRAGEAIERLPPTRCIGAMVGTEYIACSRAADRSGWRCSACSAHHLAWSQARTRAREAERMREQEGAQIGRSASRLAAAMRMDPEGEG